MYSSIARRALLSSLNRTNQKTIQQNRTIKAYWPTTGFAIYWRTPLTLIPFIAVFGGMFMIDQEVVPIVHPEAKGVLQ